MPGFTTLIREPDPIAGVAEFRAGQYPAHRLRVVRNYNGAVRLEIHVINGYAHISVDRDELMYALGRLGEMSREAVERRRDGEEEVR